MSTCKTVRYLMKRLHEGMREALTNRVKGKGRGARGKCSPSPLSIFCGNLSVVVGRVQQGPGLREFRSKARNLAGKQAGRVGSLLQKVRFEPLDGGPVTAGRRRKARDG